MCASQIDKMQECLSDVRQWMLTNKLKLNDSKTEVLVIAAKSNIKLTENIKVKIGEEVISPTPVACNLGATLDNTMSMECQISSVTRKVYYNLRRIAKIKQYLTPSACAHAINSTVISRLDFHNGLLLGLPAKTLSRLQLAQHNAARVLTGTKRAEHITPVLQKLHWLPVQQRVAFKVLTTIQKALHSPTAPAYLAELLPLYRPRRSLRSSADEWTIQVNRVHNKYGTRSFNVLGAKVWNELPAELRCLVSPAVFRKHLKTYLFRQAYELT